MPVDRDRQFGIFCHYRHPTLIGGGPVLSQTFSSLELSTHVRGAEVQPGRYVLQTYIHRDSVNATAAAFPNLVLNLPLRAIAPRLNIKELKSICKIHSIQTKRGAVKADFIAAVELHNCSICDEYRCVFQPYLHGTGLNAQPPAFRREYIEKLAPGVKPFSFDELCNILPVPEQSASAFKRGAVFVRLEEAVGNDVPLTLSEDGTLTTPTVPWMMLARKGSKGFLQYLAQLHGLPLGRRFSKDEVITELDAHLCVHCSTFTAIFKAKGARTRKVKEPVVPVQSATDAIASIHEPDVSSVHDFPPPPLRDEERRDMIGDFCEGVRPVNFEEWGCTVCGQLTLLRDLIPIDEADCSLECLVEPGVARKERLSASESIVFETGPIVESRSSCICPPCLAQLRKGKRPVNALANGLWVGCVPEVLSKLTYTEQCLIARVRANRYVMRVASGHSKMIANVIAFASPVVKVYQHLPPRRDELSEVLAFIFTGIKPPTEEDLGRTPMLVRRNAVSEALEWLKLNHADYADLVIDQDALASYPESGVPVEIIVKTSADGSNIIASATSIHDTSDEVGVDAGPCPFTVHGLIGSRLDTMTMAARKAVALEHLRSGGSVLAVGHAETPESMYDNYRLYPQMYPWLFPYGMGGIGNHKVKGLLSETRHKRWMLMFMDKRFQTDARFVVMAFNHEQLKAGSQSSFVLAKRSNFGNVAEKLSRISPAVLMNISHRLQAGERVTPTTEEEKLCFSIMDQIENISQSVHGSLAGKKRNRSELWSMITYKGAPSWFVTLSPVDTKHPISLYWSDKQMRFCPDLREYNERARLVAANPVAGARFFHFLVELLVTCLLRWNDKDGRRGAFGHTAAYFGTVEQQGRMTLHLHMLIWVSGAWNPKDMKEMLLSDDSEFKTRLLAYLEDCHIGEYLTGKMDDIKERLDGVNKTDVDDPTQRLPTPPPRSSCSIEGCQCIECVAVRKWEEEYERTVDNIVYRSNVHKCYTRRDVVENGVHKQHVTGKGCINKDGICTARFPRDIRSESEIDENGHIFMKKLEPNINTINPIMSYVFTCNTDCTSLNSGTAVNATSGYIADYLVKFGLKTYQIFSSIYDVFERNPDLAVESKDNTSSARKLILKMANALTSKVEVGGPMAAMYLLGNPDRYSSHEFVPLYWRSYVNEVMNDWENAAHREDSADREPPSIYTSFPASQIGRGDEIPNNTDGDEDLENGDPHEDEQPGERVILSRKNGRFISRSNIDDYKLRPLELENVSLYDWVQCAVRKPKSKSDKAHELHYLYHPGHGLRDTHWVHFDPTRVDKVIPTILGPYLPRKDAEDEDLYGCTMLTFFMPWRSGLDLRSSAETWTEAFRAATFNARHMSIMRNMNIRYECYDARDDFHAQLKARAANKDIEDCGSGELSDDEDGDFVETLDISVDDCFEEFRLGEWTKRRLAQMKDVESVLHKAGWTVQASPTEQTQSELFHPDRMLTAKKWKEIVNKERNKLLNARMRSVPSTRELQDDMDIPRQVVNDARVIPGAYLLDDFRTGDQDIHTLMNKIVEKFSLNNEQERAFRIVANHLVSVAPESLKMYIGGMGGTGKTQVIRALLHWFQERGQSHRMVVLAPTGAAASIINGSTYHSFLGVNTGDRRDGKEPKGPAFQQAKLRMRGVDYIFLDEISMVSCQDFFLIDLQLKYITHNLDEPFGGVNFIVAGDFAQLPPAKGNSLYSSEVSQVQLPRQTKRDQENTLGLLLWHQFVTVVILKQNMRQANNSPEDVKLRNALTRMRYKECNEEDIDFLRSRIADFNPTISLSDERWRDVSVITAWNAHKDQINTMNAQRFAYEQGVELYHFYCIDKQSTRGNGHTKKRRTSTTTESIRLTEETQKVLWSSPPYTSEHIPACLPLCVGMPVMIRNNEATELCITKGQEAIVKGWACHEIFGHPGRLALDTLFVQLVNAPKDIVLPHLPRNVVPLTMLTTPVKAILPNDRTIAISRQQVPVMINFAMTDYASQGKTRPINVVDIRHCRNHQAIYTALSRGKSAADTVIVRDFSVTKIMGGLSGFLRQEFRELDVLDQVSTLKYERKLPDYVVQRLRGPTLARYRSYVSMASNDMGSQTANDATPVRHALSFMQMPVDTVPAIQTSSGRKRKRPMVSPGQNKRRIGTHDVTQGITTMQGWRWDSVNWSCAFDTYLTVLRALYLDEGVIATQRAEACSDHLKWLFAEFRKLDISGTSMAQVREDIRKRFWLSDPVSFPRGALGSDIYALSQHLHGVSLDHLRTTPGAWSTLTCTNCGQVKSATAYERLDSYNVVLDGSEPASVKQYLSDLFRPRGTCEACPGNLFLNNTLPPLLCVQLPDTTGTRARSLPEINLSFMLENVNYRLYSVVYWSAASHHFEARIIDRERRVFRYDGMRHGGAVVHEPALSHQVEPLPLQLLDGKKASLALYMMT